MIKRLLFDNLFRGAIAHADDVHTRLHLVELATLCVEDVCHLSISIHDDTLDARSTCITEDNASGG